MHVHCGILLYILTVLLTSGSCLRLAQPQSITKISYWRQFPYTGPVTLNYYSLIPNSSLIRCIATCWPLYNWDQIYFQGGNCYCLAPVNAESGQVSGTVTTNSESMVLNQDLVNCFVKGYTTFSDQRYCLKFYSTLVNFENAELQCRYDGGHLMSVYTHQDFDNFRSLYTHNQSVYVGGHRTLDGSLFDWIHGGTVDSSFWKFGEPNNYLGVEDCVEVQSTGVFGDTSCSTLYAFICQILTKLRQSQGKSKL